MTPTDVGDCGAILNHLPELHAARRRRLIVEIRNARRICQQAVATGNRQHIATAWAAIDTRLDELHAIRPVDGLGKQQVAP